MCVFFFNDTATTEIYTLSLHDALPISTPGRCLEGHGPSFTRVVCADAGPGSPAGGRRGYTARGRPWQGWLSGRSEEHTSELQSRQYLVCRLLLEKKKKTLSTRRRQLL